MQDHKFTDAMRLCTQVGSVHKGNAEPPMIQEIFVALRGLIKIHSPALIITVKDVAAPVLEAIKMASSRALTNTTVVCLPATSFPHALWMADIRTTALMCKRILMLDLLDKLDKILSFLPDIHILVTCGGFILLLQPGAHLQCKIEEFFYFFKNFVGFCFCSLEHNENPGEHHYPEPGEISTSPVAITGECPLPR